LNHEQSERQPPAEVSILPSELKARVHLKHTTHCSEETMHSPLGRRWPCERTIERVLERNGLPAPLAD
jgi:hypothetical protein